jgi:phosphatidylcholine synthase
VGSAYRGYAMMRWIAASVHLLTALGSVCALFAALAIFDKAPERLFFWLGVALVIDGIDGTLARAARVKERLPRFSGETLDLVVDYVTYVFVPVLALLAWQHLNGVLGHCLAAVILLSSLYHFSDTQSKNEDNCFVGFPAIWNIVAFLVFALGLPPSATAAIVMLAIAGTFIPMPWIHPLRVEKWRAATIIGTVAASAASIYTVATGFPARPLAAWILAAMAIYSVAFSVYWYLKSRTGPAEIS